MIFFATQVFFLVLLELLRIRVLVRVLPMRSKLGFAMTTLAIFVLTLILRYQFDAQVLRTLLGVLLNWLIVPIAFSSGPLMSRVGRTAAVFLACFAAEFIAALVFSLLSGGAMVPQVVNEKTFGAFLMAYLADIMVSIVVYESLIALFARLDWEPDAPIEVSVLAFLLESLVLLLLLELRFYFTPGIQSAGASVALEIYCLVSLFAALGLAWTARLDARSRRSLVLHEASRRQMDLLKGQVAETTERADEMRRLRHDLANQVDLVRELAADGRIEEADAHLRSVEKLAERIGRAR